jgi:hypothetical protein
VEGLSRVHSQNMDFNLSKVSRVVAATSTSSRPYISASKFPPKMEIPCHQDRLCAIPFFTSLLSFHWITGQLERNTNPFSLSGWAPMPFPWYRSSISGDRAMDVILSLERTPCPLWMILMRHPVYSIFCGNPLLVLHRVRPFRH